MPGTPEVPSQHVWLYLCSKVLPVPAVHTGELIQAVIICAFRDSCTLGMYREPVPVVSCCSGVWLHICAASLALCAFG